MSEIIRLQAKCKHQWPTGNMNGLQSCLKCGLTRPDPKYTWTGSSA